MKIEIPADRYARASRNDGGRRLIFHQSVSKSICPNIQKSRLKQMVWLFQTTFYLDSGL